MFKGGCAMRITVALCLVLALAAPAAFAGTAWYWGDSDTVTLDAGTGYCSLTYNSNSIDVVGNGWQYRDPDQRHGLGL